MGATTKMTTKEEKIIEQAYRNWFESFCPGRLKAIESFEMTGPLMATDKDIKEAFMAGFELGKLIYAAS